MTRSPRGHQSGSTHPSASLNNKNTISGGDCARRSLGSSTRGQNYLNAKKMCVVTSKRSFLLLLVFFETVCTKVGISEGLNPGKRERKSAPPAAGNGCNVCASSVTQLTRDRPILFRFQGLCHRIPTCDIWSSPTFPALPRSHPPLILLLLLLLHHHHHHLLRHLRSVIMNCPFMPVILNPNARFCYGSFQNLPHYSNSDG